MGATGTALDAIKRGDYTPAMPRTIPPDQRRPRRGVKAASGRALPLTSEEKDDQRALLDRAIVAARRWIPGVGPALGWAPEVAERAGLDLDPAGTPLRRGAYGRTLLSDARRGTFRLPAEKRALILAFVEAQEKDQESSPPRLTVSSAGAKV